MTPTTPRKNAWLTVPKPNPEARVRLFCFPYAGGSAALFRNWPQLLPDSVEVYGVELPGRGRRLTETPIPQLPLLIQAVAHVLLPYTDKPFAFFGHSMGALVSFELARHLRRHHRCSPVQLFMSGHRAPHLPDPDPPIHALPELEFIKELSRLNGTPKEVLENQELMELLLPILRADFAVGETYTYRQEPPLACRVSAFGGIQDEEASRQELEAWREQTSSSFSLHLFPGDHFFLQTAQSLLLQTLTHELNQLVRLVGGEHFQGG